MKNNNKNIKLEYKKNQILKHHVFNKLGEFIKKIGNKIVVNVLDSLTNEPTNNYELWNKTYVGKYKFNRFWESKNKFDINIYSILMEKYDVNIENGEYLTQLEGGRGAGLHIEDVDPYELLAGIEVEFEHTDDPYISLEIAFDHLAEMNNYYTNLVQMEIDNGHFPEKAYNWLKEGNKNVYYKDEQNEEIVNEWHVGGVGGEATSDIHPYGLPPQKNEPIVQEPEDREIAHKKKRVSINVPNKLWSFDDYLIDNFVNDISEGIYADEIQKALVAWGEEVMEGNTVDPGIDEWKEWYLKLNKKEKEYVQNMTRDDFLKTYVLDELGNIESDVEDVETALAMQEESLKERLGDIKDVLESINVSQSEFNEILSEYDNPNSFQLTVEKVINRVLKGLGITINKEIFEKTEEIINEWYESEYNNFQDWYKDRESGLLNKVQERFKKIKKPV